MARYQPEHKEQTRKRLVESAVTTFRREGVDSAALKEIMQELGLTVGGFYRHFSSKTELVQTALRVGLEQSVRRMQEVADGAGADGESTEWIEQVTTAYLSDPHRRSLAHGCVLAALASDLARGDREVKTVCEEGLRSVHAEVCRHVPAGSEQLAQKIWALLALELGGLLLSRMVATEETSAEILASCRGVVHSLLDVDRPKRRDSTTAPKGLGKRGGRRIGKSTRSLLPK